MQKGGEKAMDNDRSIEEQNFDQLAAAFNNHQVTDEEGQIFAEETATDESAAQETNTEEETVTAEKSEEGIATEPKKEAKTTENAEEAELAEDESGKRYVPEKKFKKTYAEKKQLERELQELKTRLQTTEVTQTQSVVSPDVETELLYVAMPQFNPNSDQYNKKLDDLGGAMFRANPGITKVEAARRALRIASELTSDQARIVSEARTIKAQQSDQGITSRVVSRSTQAVDPERMTLQEKEAYLKANGQWD